MILLNLLTRASSLIGIRIPPTSPVTFQDPIPPAFRMRRHPFLGHRSRCRLKRVNPVGIPRGNPRASGFPADLPHAVARWTTPSCGVFPNGDRIYGPSHVPRQQGDEEGGCIRDLLDSDVVVNFKGIDGRTALHVTGRQGFLDVVNLLLFSGAVVDPKDR